MKKISLLALMVIAGFVLQAQSVDIGLKGGLNLASWSNNNPDVTYQNRMGYYGGLFARLHINPDLAIQPEVLYSTQGTEYTRGLVEHNLRMNYILIPVMAQVNVGKGFYAEAGPQVGFLTSLFADGAVMDRVGDVETGFFSESDFKKTDVALGFGVGYATATPFGVNVRYNLGLTNSNAEGSNNIKNNVLQLGLTFRLGGSSAKRF